MSEENKQLIRRLFEAIDKGDVAILNQFMAPDYRDHSPPPFPDLPAGIAGSHKAFELNLIAFSDFHHTVDDQIAEGDKVVSRITGWGRHTGDLLGIPPTGKEVRMTGIAVHRIEDGKIVEHWAQIDALGLLQQLGAISPLGAPRQTEEAAGGRAAGSPSS